MASTKSFDISKQLVWNAYKRVKANKGAAGVDRVSLSAFEQNLKGNLYKIWNRMSSGSYMPPAVQQVNIPKKDGGIRSLGVPTVSDRVAQMVVKMLIEPDIDRCFHTDSYGYRPGKSALQAVDKTRQRCWRMDWVVEFDIKGAFDNIDHALLMKAVRHHVKEPWALLYIERWLKAPTLTVDSTLVPRTQGTPQGGVISPLLMNLFMHYAFDVRISKTSPKCPFAKYADDAVVHCHSEAQANYLLRAIEVRLKVCKLTMHPTKSKIVYCKDSNRPLAYPIKAFTFLGFTFRPRKANNKEGKLFTSFLPAVSNEALKSMRSRIRTWRLSVRTPSTLVELSRLYNPILRGWFQYYGCFYPTQMRKLADYLELRLGRWARRKYKRLAGHKRKSAQWLRHVAKSRPSLFIHWHYFEDQRLGNGSRMI
ncbi:group II intron reverse transcriptase/maturase [Vibrio sp. 1180_3]|uniref:group II intron reverse transcriptase/maturase n=1 Tax=Vibrio sp. 1180_3 TaxID=2528832 RepID=UPI00240588D5|nr:group II intron reverse transcriptase/maturase [Vibrio sp. 1180_3]MDF9401112.1 group II intron reverse transcriptase/maturase [Vibrio sp. 1180_3]